jgi:N-acetylglutamate synthase-like GNAT family acetyltransferase
MSDEVVIRLHRPGDLGWLLHRYAITNIAEEGWNDRHEADLFALAAAFLQTHDPARERLWVAERDGAVAGCVALVDDGEGRARLRLLFVDPEIGRGRGIGSRLVETCLSFAREVGYREVVLGTMDALAPARRLYERFGFRKIASEPHTDYGPPLQAETWLLTL